MTFLIGWNSNAICPVYHYKEQHESCSGNSVSGSHFIFIFFLGQIPETMCIFSTSGFCGLESKWIFWMGFWIHAENKDCGQHKLKLFLRFILHHKLHPTQAHWKYMLLPTFLQNSKKYPYIWIARGSKTPTTSFSHKAWFTVPEVRLSKTNFRTIPCTILCYDFKTIDISNQLKNVLQYLKSDTFQCSYGWVF